MKFDPENPPETITAFGYELTLLNREELVLRWRFEEEQFHLAVEYDQSDLITDETDNWSAMVYWKTGETLPGVKASWFSSMEEALQALIDRVWLQSSCLKKIREKLETGPLF